MSKSETKNPYKDSIHLPKTGFAMKAGLVQKEPKMLAQWEQMQIYQQLQTQRADAPSYILHDGPPYANGNIHAGHAMQKVLKDFVIKSRNLQGFRVPYVPGWDCHGLPIEIQVEKKWGKVGAKISASEFREKCRAYAAKQVAGQKQDFMRLGIQGEWDNPYLTMDYQMEADTVRSLAKIVESGHLYHGLMPVYWCPACASALAEAEVEYQEKTSPAIDVLFPIKDTSEFARAIGVEPSTLNNPGVVIWTTTPWTLPANEAVCLHPEVNYVLIEVENKQLILAQDLVESALARYGFSSTPVIKASFLGKQLERLSVSHPFYDKSSLLIVGDHVTTDSGTGCVHTAPAHGADDFFVGKKYDLPIQNPVGANGTFLPSTELFGGKFVFSANDGVIQVLQDKGMLLHHESYQHSYPHCWRHKTPMIYRTTAQWFIGMERKPGEKGLRKEALSTIKDVRWLPEWGLSRIQTMIENRPDWCISRQRNWGVPIAIFLHKESGEMHPNSVQLMERVAQHIEKEGVQAWFDLSTEQLLGKEANEYDKVTDIVDVWFDSGVTHSSVLAARDTLNLPADLYLEGSDQHRGWFQSSLLSSVAMGNKAPYKTVLTHGFVVDENGRKMSKSLGNVIAPQTIVNSLGADIFRLWVSSTDYRSEVSLSDEIVKRTADTYRRIRNTARYFLGNLHDFDTLTSALDFQQMLLLDQWALRRVKQLQQDITQAYDEFNFHVVYQKIHHFCIVDMGGFYLDVLKDRLYTCPKESIARRSAQTAMQHVLETLVRCLMPILPFTAEEIWQHMPKREEKSILLTKNYSGLSDLLAAPEDDKLWDTIITVRNKVLKDIEHVRSTGNIGSALDAKVSLYAKGELFTDLERLGQELRFVLISSEVEVLALTENKTSLQDLPLAIEVSQACGEKCVRCWHRREEVGTLNHHPELCQRCVDNVDGEGEQRAYA